MKLQQADLATVQAELLVAIDNAAEQVRTQYVTPGSAQAMVYLQKRAEAEAYLADSEASAPHIHAEALATGQTPEAVASEVIAMAGQWQAVSAEIEAKRQGAKKAVMAATTITTARQAAQVEWGSEP